MKKHLFLMIVFTLFSLMLSSCSEIVENPDYNNPLSDSVQNYSGDGVVKFDNSYALSDDLQEKSKETLSAEEADFRSMKWGMSKDEVMYYEGTGFSEPADNIMYYTRVREEGYPANAEYTFVEDKLAQGVFFITHDKEDNPIGLEDYTDLVGSLTARFGEPDIKQQFYYDESYKTDDTTKHIDLIMKNKLNYRTAWLLEGTELRVVLLNANNELCIGLQYKDADVEIPASK